MLSIPVPRQLASAAAVFHGRHGAVTALARQRVVSRQTLYREAHAACRTLQSDPTAPLRQQLHEHQQVVRALRQQLRQAVVVDADRQAEFAATAQAQGVSLTAAHALLGVLLRQDTQSRATLGRLSRTAARRAVDTVAVLDEFSRPRARQVAADEIFAGRRPVLMTIEQDSLCWLGGRMADSREGAEWAREFQQLPAAEQVTRDGGQSLCKGLESVNASRCRQGQAPIADQEDHFHLLQRARRALREVRSKAVRAFRQAEVAQRDFERDARRGLRRSAMRSRLAKQRWRRAEQAFDRWSALERAFERLRAALRLFTPEGELNTRERATALVHEALSELTGPEWARARRRLAEPETFTFLDRVQERLAAVPVPAAVRALLVRADGRRCQPEARRAAGVPGAVVRGLALLAGLVLARLGASGAHAVPALRAVLRQARRASSLVEGVNSVLRMHQGRQKRLTPELLALKRPHWNLHVFAAGRRKGQSPYQRLWIVLPEASWWEILQQPPEQLRQQLSALNPAA